MILFVGKCFILLIKKLITFTSDCLTSYAGLFLFVYFSLFLKLYNLQFNMIDIKEVS